MAGSAVDRSKRNSRTDRGWHTRRLDAVPLGSIAAEGVDEESGCASIVDSFDASQFDDASDLENARRDSGTSSPAAISVDWKAARANGTRPLDRHVAFSARCDCCHLLSLMQSLRSASQGPCAEAVC